MTLPAFAADHGRLHRYQSIVGICCLRDTQQQNIHVTAAVDRRDRQTDAHLRPSSAYYIIQAVSTITTHLMALFRHNPDAPVAEKHHTNGKNVRTTGKLVKIFLEICPGWLWPSSNCHGLAVKVVSWWARLIDVCTLLLQESYKPSHSDTICTDHSTFAIHNFICAPITKINQNK